MNTTVKNELKRHLLDCINEERITNENKDEWHYYAFNYEDYYIIYHSKAIEWLKKHSINTFDAIDTVKQYEENTFDAFTTDVNPENIVNMLAYIYGEEVLNSYDVETVEELESQLLKELLTSEIVAEIGTEIDSTKKDFIFFNLANQIDITEYVITDDYDRYKNQYSNFIAVNNIKEVMQVENNTPSHLSGLITSGKIDFYEYQFRTKAFESNIKTYKCI